LFVLVAMESELVMRIGPANTSPGRLWVYNLSLWARKEARIDEIMPSQKRERAKAQNPFRGSVLQRFRDPAFAQ